MTFLFEDAIEWAPGVESVKPFHDCPYLMHSGDP